MTTRDRTSLFVQYRQSFGINQFSNNNRKAAVVNISDYSDQSSLLRSNFTKPEDVSIEMQSLPPKWLEDVEFIEEEITKLKDKIVQVETMHKKNILPGFDDTGKEEETIELLTQDITMDFHRIQKKIKRISDEHKAKNNDEDLLGRNVTISLATKLQEISSRFKQSQQNYLQKIRNRVSSSINNNSPAGSSSRKNEIFGVPVVPESNPLEMNFDLGFNEQQLKQIHSNEAAIDQRSHEINEVSKSIFQLAEVFRDLQTMIIDQGTLLDRIDYNIEDMAKNVKSAHQELQQGEKYQKQAGTKMRFICLAVLGIFIIILLIALFLKRSSR